MKGDAVYLRDSLSAFPLPRRAAAARPRRARAQHREHPRAAGRVARARDPRAAVARRAPGQAASRRMAATGSRVPCRASRSGAHDDAAAERRALDGARARPVRRTHVGPERARHARASTARTLSSSRRRACPTSRALFDFDAVHRVPPVAAAGFEAAFLRILESERIDLVIPCRDDERRVHRRVARPASCSRATPAVRHRGDGDGIARQAGERPVLSRRTACRSPRRLPRARPTSRRRSSRGTGFR